MHAIKRNVGFRQDLREAISGSPATYLHDDCFPTNMVNMVKTSYLVVMQETTAQGIEHGVSSGQGSFCRKSPAHEHHALCSLGMPVLVDLLCVHSCACR